ncbi:hypothetical protein [Paenibacillus sp. NPDC055715]
MRGKLGYFPPFHYDQNTATDITKDQILLTIELSPATKLTPKSPDLTPSAEQPSLSTSSTATLPRYAVNFTFLEIQQHALTAEHINTFDNEFGKIIDETKMKW